ncbi:MAG: YceI family protein [Terriglobales bacterium]
MTTTAIATQVTTWNIDPAHSAAEFKVRHMMISNVKGRFSGVSGALQLNEADLTDSTVTASIEAGSIDTREPQRDAHLKSADFFDVENFPTLSFTSTGIARDEDGEITVAGDLTMHGVTRSVMFAVESFSKPSRDPWGNLRIGLSAATKINRKDFGMTFNAALETGGVLVGDEVTITLEVEFIGAA